eukprot:TRINITY_DN3599_c0_g1_i2.p1 TRINITY_DN3599_c0_g1~~TRINITY_DN3599_c0_g1_i2.p1  ORF type:complete len:298 (-),score=60.25 TRINITY_DN3599_c0_g1_i2:94-909(-)
MSQYKDFLAAAEEVAMEAGKGIKEAFYLPKNVEFKGGVIDLVTDVDKKTEELIISTLHAKFPSHFFLGEESTAQKTSSSYHRTSLTSDPTWIIDPIDGTTNFVHQYPWVSISIALAIDKVVVVGLVYNPIIGEKFTAIRGQGAFCNNERIHVSQTKELARSMIGIGFPYNRSKDSLDHNLGRLRAVLENCREARRTGSAALDTCSVAIGRLDAYYEAGIHSWDIAAGTLVVEEAGGVVLSSRQDKPFDLEGEDVLVGNPDIGPLLFKLFNK